MIATVGVSNYIALTLLIYFFIPHRYRDLVAKNLPVRPRNLLLSFDHSICTITEVLWCMFSAHPLQTLSLRCNRTGEN